MPAPTPRCSEGCGAVVIHPGFACYSCSTGRARLLRPETLAEYVSAYGGGVAEPPIPPSLGAPDCNVVLGALSPTRAGITTGELQRDLAKLGQHVPVRVLEAALFDLAASSRLDVHYPHTAKQPRWFSRDRFSRPVPRSCRHGHPLDGGGVDILPNGTRCCRVCHVLAQRRYKLRRRERPHVCRNGNPLSPENVVIDRQGHRHCRTCRVEAARRYTERLQAGRRQSGGQVDPDTSARPPRHTPRQTHCKRGHVFDGDNVRIAADPRSPSGIRRACRACEREQEKRRRERRAQVAA